ncbi:plant UBX domain-containing protein 4-like [Actinidia eriantha]|uniref:plant UBX domain-containing protein 4-like n=1 Tax=Actinidia eriantha TaxID=165200 RepID=UPI002585D48C|nr:plant UBX domain-containing protein 4-like [Actinidia eriantha]XP_057498314.1 plant UBX domain-containing protein 4-like [Actinidia eriantha]
MASRDKKPAKPSTSRTGGIRTLSDLNRPSGHDSDSDSDGPQEYYTGGEKSGMLVQDPSKGNDVDAIFDQARQMGAVQGPLENLNPSSSSRSFSGTGRLLSGETVPSATQPPEAVNHNIVFWRNGFTINDGPLRRLDDTENAPFLESIRKSECPKELEPADRRSSVHVNLIRRDEDCPEPEKHHVPFQGVGRTLGGSTTPAASEPTADTSLSTAPTSSIGVVVDENSPSTSIQLRLADGTRMIAHFNHHHTIGDIHAFIDASRPGSNRTYQLQSVGFPPKLLNDPSQTIKQAGLANSVVIQRL